MLIAYKADYRLLLTAAVVDLLLLFWTAFRFTAAARQANLAELAALKENHAKEREKIRVNAERQKTRLVNKSHKQLLKETRRAHAAANFKTGAALAGILALGGLMLSSQFTLFGLLILSTGGGGAAGYLVRMRQEKAARNREKLSAGFSAFPEKKAVKKLE